MARFIRIASRVITALAAWLIPAAGAFAQTGPSSAPALTRGDLEAWLDSLVPRAIAQGDIAGLVVSIVKDGQVLLEKGYGLADVRGSIAADAGTIIRVASLSKAFTATAVMQLVEQQKLDLDTDVNAYLDFAIPAAFGKPVTLRHLLTHTAGFEETSYKRYRPPRSLREHVVMVPDRIYPPGELPAYSNYGLTLAGYIVQRVSSESFADYIERHILQPLGMERSSFRMTLPESLRLLEAKSYPVASSGEPYAPELIAEMVPTEAPASGLATTARDMSRFMLAHLGQGPVQVLSPATRSLMHDAEFVAIPGAQPIALGLFRSDYRGRRVLGHSGDGEGQHADMKLVPELGLGLFSAVNSDGTVETGLPAGFALRQELFTRFMDRYFPRAPAADEPTAPTAAEHARLVAGEYVWSRQQRGDYQEALGLITRYLGLKLSITANPDGTITTTPFMTLSTEPRTWREIAPFAWREASGEARLVMKVEHDRVRAVWSDDAPTSWVNLPVPFLLSARLNVPLLGLSFVILLVLTVLWPIGALARRRRGRAGEPRATTVTRLAVLLGLLYLLGWAAALAMDVASMVGAEKWVRLLQLVGLACVAGTLVAIADAATAWREARGAWRKARSLLAALALAYLAWFSLAFHLISVRIN